MGKATGAALVPRVSSIWDISFSKLSKLSLVSKIYFVLKLSFNFS